MTILKCEYKKEFSSLLALLLLASCGAVHEKNSAKIAVIPQKQESKRKGCLDFTQAKGKAIQFEDMFDGKKGKYQLVRLEGFFRTVNKNGNRSEMSLLGKMSPNADPNDLTITADITCSAVEGNLIFENDVQGTAVLSTSDGSDLASVISISGKGTKDDEGFVDVAQFKADDTSLKESVKTLDRNTQKVSFSKYEIVTQTEVETIKTEGANKVREKEIIEDKTVYYTIDSSETKKLKDGFRYLHTRRTYVVKEEELEIISAEDFDDIEMGSTEETETRAEIPAPEVMSTESIRQIIQPETEPTEVPQEQPTYLL